MSVVLKKGAQSRSYPSRQQKLGPAPFASFEDLDEVEVGGRSESSGAEKQHLSEIVEDERECPCSSQPHLPPTGTSSGLQTPSTPRIDISCASSSTPPSEEEAELFQGGLGLAFQEEGTDDLRSSTEELDLGQVDIDSEEERRQKRQEELRRGSHPADIFRRRDSSPKDRKPSAHTLFIDSLLSRHASFGAGGDHIHTRPFSSQSARSTGSMRRSPSPHKMMLETSFCGNKPIPTKSMEQESPPKSPSPVLPQFPTRFDDEPTTTQKTERSGSIKSTNVQLTPALGSPTSSCGRRPSGRSVSPFKMLYETSFCGSKPIPTKSMDMESPPTSLIAAQINKRSPAVSKKNWSPQHSLTWGEKGDDDDDDELPIQVEDKVLVVEDEGCGLGDWDEGAEENMAGKEEAIFLHDSFEDEDEMPYAPTTLPQEKPTPPLFPSRKKEYKARTIPTERPKVQRPPNPASINDYIAYSSQGNTSGASGSGCSKSGEDAAAAAKMKISLPREGSLGRKSSRGSIGATNWADFAQLGLQSPREMRRKLREEENGENNSESPDDVLHASSPITAVKNSIVAVRGRNS